MPSDEKIAINLTINPIKGRSDEKLSGDNHSSFVRRHLCLVGAPQETVIGINQSP